MRQEKLSLEMNETCCCCCCCCCLLILEMLLLFMKTKRKNSVNRKDDRIRVLKDEREEERRTATLSTIVDCLRVFANLQSKFLQERRQSLLWLSLLWLADGECAVASFLFKEARKNYYSHHHHVKPSSATATATAVHYTRQAPIHRQTKDTIRRLWWWKIGWLIDRLPPSTNVIIPRWPLFLCSFGGWGWDHHYIFWIVCARSIQSINGWHESSHLKKRKEWSSW